MSGGIEEAEGVGFVTNPETYISVVLAPCTWWKAEDLHHRHRIVVKYRGHIFRWKFVGGVADEQTCLADRTVTNYHTSVHNNCQLQAKRFTRMRMVPNGT